MEDINAKIIDNEKDDEFQPYIKDVHSSPTTIDYYAINAAGKQYPIKD